jgi:hypothetical protein
MAAPDPDFWKEAATWMAGVLVLPIGYVWKKVNGALPKDEFMKFCERFDDHVKRDQEIQGKLFDQMRENEQRAQDRYERLMERLSQ